MNRKVLIAALVLMPLCFGNRLSAGNFGVVGGANFYTTNVKDFNTYSMTQWHAGLTYKFDLPVGFQIQPTLLYNVKGANVKSDYGKNLSVGYLELLAPVQWGVDLILFRPFLEVAPFLGYGLDSWGDFKSMWRESGNRFEYGVGLGGGLSIWRFQVTARYNWNFGNLMQAAEVVNAFEDANFSGVSLSLAFFF